MPLDQRYVERLDDFTKSLDGIVELLKQEVGRDNVDVVNRLLSNMNDDLKSVVENMTTVLNTTGRIESQNDRILEEVRAVRAARENGMFGEVTEVDNKKKILDAVKVIVLIAAGVLALGMAFKIIGAVNFLSVIAIGLAIVFITGAFVMVAALTDNMNYGDVVNISGLMVVMALGVMVSSWALSMAATLSFGKIVSIIFTAGALGTSLVLIARAIEKSQLKPSDYPKLALLPLVLPFIAIGIAISSIILARVATLTFAQVMTTVFVATAIGVSLYLITQALDKSKMEKKHVGQILLLPIIIPALAMGLVLSSWILSGVKTLSFGQMLSAVFTAVTVGVLVYLMKPLIEKMKDFSLTEILKTSLLVVALSAGLVAASWVLSGMKLMGFKESLLLIMNSLAIGLAVLFLTPAVYVLKSIKTEEMLTAAGNVIITAGAIAVSSWLLSIGLYENVPDVEWAIGAGLSIFTFAGAIWLVSKLKMSPEEMAINALVVVGISATIMITSWILSMGNYDDYPGIGWVMGVGLTLVAFGGAIYLLGKYVKDPTSMLIGAAIVLGVSATIMLTSLILGLGNYDDYPNLDWAQGVGLSLLAFGGSMAILGSFGPAVLLSMGIGALAVFMIAGTIVATSYILNLGNYSEYPDLDWAQGVGLSIITFGGTMALLGLLGPVGFAIIGMGALSMILVAGTIVLVSQILAMGDYSGGPSIDWAVGNGALLFAVGVSSVMFAFMLPMILLGSYAMKTIANTIVDVSNILASGDYSGGPTEEWAKGVGGSIKAFAEGISAMNSGGGLFGMLFGSDQSDKITGIAQAMVDASFILQNGQWTSYPPADWSKGVGDSILAFAKGIKELEEADIDSGFEFVYIVSMLSWGLIEAAKILNSFDWNSIKNYPSEKWSKGVGAAISAFAGPLSEMAKYDVTGSDITKGIKRLSNGLVTAAEIIGDYDWDKATKYPSKEWTSGVGEALQIFVRSLVEIEKNDIGKGEIRNLNRVISNMIDTAEDFADVDEGVWKKGPPIGWTENIGSSISKFIGFLIEIEKNEIDKGAIRVLNSAIDSMIRTAKRFFEIEKLHPTIWKSGPTDGWSISVGNSIGKFVGYLIEIEKNDVGGGDLKVLNKTIDSMIRTAFKFYIAEKLFPTIWSAGPTVAWGESIEKSLGAFVNATKNISSDNVSLLDDISDSMVSFAKKLEKLLKNKDMYSRGGLFDTFSDSMKKLTESLPTSTTMADGLNALGDALLKISSIGDSSGDSIRNLTKSIIEMSDSLKKVDMGSIDKLSKFSNGILVLSLIDEKKFEDALNVINKKKNEVIAILSDSPTVRSKSNVGENRIENTSATEPVTSSKDKFYAELLSRVKSLDENVLKIFTKEAPVTEPSDEEEMSRPSKSTGKDHQTNQGTKVG